MESLRGFAKEFLPFRLSLFVLLLIMRGNDYIRRLTTAERGEETSVDGTGSGQATSSLSSWQALILLGIFDRRRPFSQSSLLT